MGWFGPSRDEVWERLSHEVGAEFTPGGFWKTSKVQARVGVWTITLDTFSRKQGQHSHGVYTRMRAPFINPNGLRFTVYRASLFSGLGRLLGMQDVEIGAPEFDDAFIVKGNDESKIIDLLSDPNIQKLFHCQKHIRLFIKNDEGWFGPSFPSDADEIYFETRSVVKDVDRLKDLFALFSTLLHRLCEIEAAEKRDPGVVL